MEAPDGSARPWKRRVEEPGRGSAGLSSQYVSVYTSLIRTTDGEEGGFPGCPATQKCKLVCVSTLSQIHFKLLTHTRIKEIGTKTVFFISTGGRQRPQLTSLTW